MCSTGCSFTPAMHWGVWNVSLSEYSKIQKISTVNLKLYLNSWHAVQHDLSFSNLPLRTAAQKLFRYKYIYPRLLAGDLGVVKRSFTVAKLVPPTREFLVSTKTSTRRYQQIQEVCLHILISFWWLDLPVRTASHPLWNNLKCVSSEIGLSPCDTLPFQQTDIHSH